MDNHIFRLGILQFAYVQIWHLFKLIWQQLTGLMLIVGLAWHTHK